MRIALAVLLAVLLVVSGVPGPVLAQTTTTTTVAVSSCGLQQQVGFNIHPNDTTYAQFDVLVSFVTCGQYVGQPIFISVGAGISNSAYQSAQSFYFTFQNAWLWNPQTGCQSNYLPPTQPSIKLALAQKATNATSTTPYLPPVYAGGGWLCFSYADSFAPEFFLVYSNGTLVSVPLRNDMSYRLTVTQAPPPVVQPWYDSPEIQSLGAVVTLLIIAQFLYVFSRTVISVGQWLRGLSSKQRAQNESQEYEGSDEADDGDDEDNYVEF